MDKHPTLVKVGSKLILSLNLADCETLRYIKCVSAQSRNSGYMEIAIRFNITKFRVRNECIKDVIMKAQNWLLEHNHNSFLKITAVVECVKDVGGVFQSQRTLFKRIN